MSKESVIRMGELTETELTAFHALSTYDLIDILTDNEFSSEEKSLASTIVKDRVSTLQMRLSNMERMLKLT